MFELQVILMGSNVAIDKDVTQSFDFKGKKMYVDGNENSFLHTGRSVSGGRSIWETCSLLNPSRF
jgi:hypothetical protein